MMPFTAEELAEIQAVLFDTTCTIYRNQSTTDTSLSRQRNWTAEHAGVACSLERVQAQPLEQGAEGRVRVAASYNLLVARTTDILTGDQVEVTGVTGRFEVQRVTPGSQEPINIVVLALVKP